MKDTDSSIVFVGFPLTSLQKFTPEGAEVTYMDDDNVSISIPEHLMGEGLDADQLNTDMSFMRELSFKTRIVA